MAEAACGFEHRDLHWGNVLLSRDPLATRKTCRLRCAALRIETTFHVLPVYLPALEHCEQGCQAEVSA